ncbi:hypothetical protein [Mariniblastus fucicola]|uniref:Uncharacterized protein n=1 Tax=Mariniblastus fucicola TaxID=980251 RepID=A0A5B9PGS7_9BACT|nr:hypothetical protein [Mariniblastus fucicola]QEG23962.1 hypothetical protein MFFC18_38670 [Mariniblastus fucicola]
MNRGESRGVQSPDQGAADVELLLQQMTLREPSSQLDTAIASLSSKDEVSLSSPVSNPARFGWAAILSTAAVAMLAGIWLGSSFVPVGETITGTSAAVIDSELSSAGSSAGNLTPVAFNVQAFNLLHGHSQQEQFEDCSLCHRLPAVGDAALVGIFKDWFYGDEQFFEAHPGGLSDCAKCHLLIEKGEFAKEEHLEFSRLVNCSECHQVNADGFDGFKRDWHASMPNSSKG